MLAMAAAAALALTGCTTMGSAPVVPQPVTVEQVVAMSRAGTPADEIIRTMRNSRTVYRLDASQLADLRDEGVSNRVIDYMQHTYLAAVARSSRLSRWDYWYHAQDGFWYGGIPYGWPMDWYWPDDFFYLEDGGHEDHDHGEVSQGGSEHHGTEHGGGDHGHLRH